MPDIDLKAALFGHEEGDLPLLEELGINFKVIKQQIIQLYTEKNIKQDISSIAYNDTSQHAGTVKVSTDLTGPLIFLIILCVGLLLNGKVLFGCVYFLSIALAIITQTMFSCMNHDQTYESQYNKQSRDNQDNLNKDNKFINQNQQNTSYVNMQYNQNNYQDNVQGKDNYQGQYQNQGRSYQNVQPQYSNQYNSRDQNYNNAVQYDKQFIDNSRRPHQAGNYHSRVFVDDIDSKKPLSFLQITSILGYSLLPIVFFVFINILLSRFYNFMLFLGIISASISAVVCNRKLNGGWLIYTLWLNYMAYVVLALY